MTTKVTGFPLAVAQEVAEGLVEALRDGCDRIEVAGSIRRKKEVVHDIELLAIPRLEAYSNAEENPGTFNWLNQYLMVLMKNKPNPNRLEKRKDSRGRTMFGAKNKYMVHVASGIPVDLFITDAKNWGMALVVRTGGAQHNQELMTRFLQLGMRGHAYGGVTLRDGTEADCPDELTVFKLAQWDWVAPEDRA